MNDEIPHLRVVYGLLRLGTPGGVGARIVRKHANDIDLAEILELDVVKACKFAAQDKMKKLLLWSLIGQG